MERLASWNNGYVWGDVEPKCVRSFRRLESNTGNVLDPYSGH